MNRGLRYLEELESVVRNYCTLLVPDNLLLKNRPYSTPLSLPQRTDRDS